MSSSTEIPDILGGVTHAIGFNRLWKSDQQADAEKRKSEQETEPPQIERPGSSTPQNTARGWSGDVAPVSVAKQRETREETDHKEAHSDDDIHVVSVRERLQTQPKTTAYEWPMPASLKRNQAKKKADAEPTKDDETAPSEENHTNGIASKSSLMASLVPLVGQRNECPGSVEDSAAAGQSPPNSGGSFSRPRLYSSSSQLPIERPKPRATRQNTMPAPLPHGDDTESGKHRSAARSRWISATLGLRFPLRRKRTADKQVAATMGAEVVTTLIAGAPAATMVGMHMVPDERGHHRVPVIIDLLKVCLP